MLSDPQLQYLNLAPRFCSEKAKKGWHRQLSKPHTCGCSQSADNRDNQKSYRDKVPSA